MSANKNTAAAAGLRLSLRQKSWNPYVVGVGIGILSWLVFLIVNKPLGMSTEISKLSGWVTGLFIGQEAVVQNSYWASHTPAVGYSTVFLICTAIGAWFSAKSSGDLALEKVPALWAEFHGASVPKRMAAAFGGGVLLLYGARMAGGCTSGHGISGTLQLALSSWLFFPVMFVAGIATAKLLFRKRAA